jgi:dimethylamine corrinoid protein
MSWLKAMREKEPPEPVNPIGTIVLGTLHPDIMDTAKEMVRKSLKAAQFKTIDAGKGVSPEAFAARAKQENADILVVTVGLSAAKENLSKLITALKNQGIYEKVTVMIGGAAVNKEDADIMGAMFGKTREEAVALAKKAIENKKIKSL